MTVMSMTPATDDDVLHRFISRTHFVVWQQKNDNFSAVIEIWCVTKISFSVPLKSSKDSSRVPRNKIATKIQHLFHCLCHSMFVLILCVHKQRNDSFGNAIVWEMCNITMFVATQTLWTNNANWTRRATNFICTILWLQNEMQTLQTTERVKWND